MKINIIGCGYVGLTCAAFLSQHAEVVCSDSDKILVNALNNQTYDCPEPFILDIIYDRNIEFSTSYWNNQDIYMICLDKSHHYDDINHSYNSYIANTLESIVHQLKEHSTPRSIIIISSDSPPGTISRCKQQTTLPLYYIPQFLRPLHAYQDYVLPQKMMIGQENSTAAPLDPKADSRIPYKVLHQFLSFHRCHDISLTDYQTAELTYHSQRTIELAMATLHQQLTMVADNIGVNMAAIEKFIGHLSTARRGTSDMYCDIYPDMYPNIYPRLDSLAMLAPSSNFFHHIQASHNDLDDFFALKLIKTFSLHGIEKGSIIIAGLSRSAFYLAPYLMKRGYFISFYLPDKRATHHPSGDDETYEIYESFDRLHHQEYHTSYEVITNLEDALPLSCALVALEEFAFDYQKIRDGLLFPLLADPHRLLDKKKIRSCSITYISVGA